MSCFLNLPILISQKPHYAPLLYFAVFPVNLMIGSSVWFPRVFIAISLTFDEIIKPSDDDFESSGLKTASVIRVSRLAVVEKSILLGRIGHIHSQRLERIRKVLSNWLMGDEWLHRNCITIFALNQSKCLFHSLLLIWQIQMIQVILHHVTERNTW